MSLPRIALAALVLTWATSCSSREGAGATDAGGSPDAASGMDASAGDASGTDAGAATDAGSATDAGATDAGSTDAGSATDAGVDAATAVDAGCTPPPCAAPPAGCHYEGAGPCTCGTLVCDGCMASTGRDCASDQWCDYPDTAACGAGGTAGTCEPRPFACPDVYMPVCGCDGVTYGNDCEAHAAGTDIVSTGACA